MANKVTKSNIGAKVKSLLQLDSLVKARRSVVWNRSRVPASIVEHQQYKIVKELVENGRLNVYIKNK